MPEITFKNAAELVTHLEQIEKEVVELDNKKAVLIGQYKEICGKVIGGSSLQELTPSKLIAAIAKVIDLQKEQA